MARTTGDTYFEGLRKILGQLGQMAALPDADLQFSTQLQSMIAGYIRAGVSSVGGGDVQQSQQAPQANLMMQPGPSGPMQGLSPSADLGSMDEIRRLVGSQNRAI